MKSLVRFHLVNIDKYGDKIGLQKLVYSTDSSGLRIVVEQVSRIFICILEVNHFHMELPNIFIPILLIRRPDLILRDLF